MNDFIRLKTTISSSLLQQVLIKGFIISCIGVIGLLIAGIFIPLSDLKLWGWLIFLISMGFIALGMIPYKRLTKLQLKPNELLIFSNRLEFFSKEKKILTIPLDSIHHIEYFEEKKRYGINFFLKHPLYKKIIIHPSENWIKKMQKGGRYHNEADLFLSYFNRRAFDELQEHLEPDQQSTL